MASLRCFPLTLFASLLTLEQFSNFLALDMIPLSCHPPKTKYLLLTTKNLYSPVL